MELKSHMVMKQLVSYYEVRQAGIFVNSDTL